MSIKILQEEDLKRISGAGRNGRDDDRSSERTSSRSKRPASGELYDGVSQQCLNDSGWGLISGEGSGAPGALTGVLSSGAVKSCTVSNSNSNGGGSISPGECTW